MNSTRQASREVIKILAKVKATDARRAYHRSGPEFTPIKALHSAREKLDDLLVDPLSLEPAAWTLSHHTVRRAYEAFVALIDAFDAFEGPLVVDETPILGPITRCARILWPCIAKWLDALLSVRGVINLEDSHDVVLSKLCATLEILFRRIDHLRDVLATTPWIYATVCKLSLYLPRYTQTDPAAKRGTLYVMDTDSKLSFVLFFATELKGPSSKDRGPTLDPLVHQGILEAVGRDLELLYHLALRQIFRILAYSLSPVRSLTASIKALTRIASRGLTLPQPSRRVSRAAVHLLRELLGQRRLPDIATYASELLCTILSTVTDDRMLAWALRDGALPLFAHMSRVQQAGAAAAYLKMIASQTISPRVLRALAHGNGGKPRSLRGAGFADEQTLEEVDAVIAERWISLQARNKRLKRCAFEKCSSPAGALHRCSCFLVAYCSPDCQRRHWRSHRIICMPRQLRPKAGRQPTIIDGIKDVPQSEINLVTMCAVSCLYMAAPTILAKLEQAREQPLTQRIKLVVDFSYIPEVPRISVETEDSASEIWVLASAHVRRGKGFYNVLLYEKTLKDVLMEYGQLQ